MKCSCVYRITSPSNHVYIGQTVNFNSRMSCYKRCACKKQIKLYNSLVKYGFDDHNVELLYNNLPKHKANKIEKLFISLYKKKNRSLNIQDGGCSNKYGGDHNNSKAIIQLSVYGDKVKLWNSAFDIDNDLKFNRSAIQNACNLRYKNNYSHGFLWMYLNDYNNNISPAYGCKYKKVVQFDLDGSYIKTWDTITEASVNLGCNPSSISGAALCSYNTNYSHGFLWLSEKDYLDNIIPIHKKEYKKLYQYDKKFNLIKIWNNITIAAKHYGISRGTISGVVNGRGKTAVGYIWSNKELRKGEK